MHPSLVPLWDTLRIEQEEHLTMRPMEDPSRLPDRRSRGCSAALLGAAAHHSQPVQVQPSGTALGALISISQCQEQGLSSKRKEGTATMPEAAWKCHMHPVFPPLQPILALLQLVQQEICMGAPHLSWEGRFLLQHDFQITCPKQRTYTFWDRCCPPWGPVSGRLLY